MFGPISTNQSPRKAPHCENDVVQADAVGLLHDAAYHRISIEIAEFFKHLRTQLWARFIFLIVLVALLSWLGSFLYALLITGSGTQLLRGHFGIAAVATVASTLTIIGLYPVLRESEHYLFETVSIMACANIEFLSLLGKVTELRGGDTPGHTLRVTAYTMLFAEALQLPRDTLVRAVKGAMLHDVGKLVIPDRLVSKPGGLTQEERAAMEKHVLRGLEIINQSQLLNAAVNVVGFHHEHYDGSGYPHGVQGQYIPVEARLFALVDVFDALTSSRVYKPALTVAEALRVMAGERGSHFDSSLFDRFIEIAPDFERKLPREERALAAMLLERLTPYLDHFLLGRTLFAPSKTPTWKAICRSLIDVKSTIVPDKAGHGRPADKS
jgi:putative nucleotidyltransferase with HDIG domain